MQNVRHIVPDLNWQSAIRRAALGAHADDRRRALIARAAVLATLGFLAMLVIVPVQHSLTPRALDDAHRSLGQASGELSNAVPADGLHPLLYPLWLLFLSRFTNDIEMAARVLSGIGAVATLFFVYQICHGLSHPDRADEQSCFALLGLALTPAFFLAAAGGGSEVPHLALMLATLLLIQRALGARDELAPMALAGAVLGASTLIRPASLLALPAVLIWIWSSRPFVSDDRAADRRAALGFAAGFVIGAAPRFVIAGTAQGGIFPWGLVELQHVGARLLSQPLDFVLGLGPMIWTYVAADDIERIAAFGSFWQTGDWGSALGTMITLAPTILKLLGVIGVCLLCTLDRFESGMDRARLPAILMLFLIVGGALTVVDERNPLAAEALLIIFAFASLPSVTPGALSGIVGLTLTGLMVFHLAGLGAAPRSIASYRATNDVATVIHALGAPANRVMTTNWTFYDTHSPWRERYRHVPLFVDNADDLVKEMKRQGVTYLVFDRQVGASQWPHLANLMETERPRASLAALRAPLRTDESPPNAIAIYKLE